MKKFIRISICFLLFLFASQQIGKASHLIGGYLGYQYMGPVGGGMFRYKVILTTYTNCDSTSQIPNPENPIQPIGVYNYNSASPNADKQFYTSVTVTLASTTLIQPAMPNNCTVGFGTCIKEGIYEGFVDLPLSFSGYYLFYERCCRNAGIVNLITDESSSFVAFIPPTLVNNSSPTFTDLPTPFLCAGDTTTILNTAVDPDGDQLIFSFVNPYSGFATAGNPGYPAPAPPNPTLTWPIPNVVYNGGYNVSQPFGAGDYAYINGTTGLTSYMAPGIGKFVVAIEIKEYRNGNLIGITRRDLQILVINCPPNPAPNLSGASGSGQTSFTITEGQNLCFPITFYDVNGDSVNLSASGQLFNSSIVNPPATITTPMSGDSIVTTNFCWTTACGQARPLPYFFNVSVPDNGCPPKTTNVVYSILVNPAPKPASIAGLPIVCQNSSTTYTTPLIAGATYSWSLTGGAITSGGNGNSITVNWGGPGSGTVSVAAISQYGCISTPFNLNVTILSSPTANAGSDKSICLGNPVQIGGSPTGPVGAGFSWSPATGLSATTIANPNASPVVTTTYIVTVNIGAGCIGTDTVVVFVGSNGSANAGNDIAICSGNNTQLNASGGVFYLWSPTTGLSNPNIANPVANPAITTVYTVTVTDAAGCLGTDNVTVTVKSNPVVNAGTNTSICTGTSVTIGGAPTGPAGSVYSWAPSATLNNSTIANPVATPLVNTTYTVTVTVTNNGCVSTGNVTVTIKTLPIADAGGDAAFCLGGNTQLTASGGTSYTWLPVTGLSNPAIFNPIASPVITTSYYVNVTGANGCIKKDTVIVTVNPLPNANAGADVSICSGNNTQLNASGGVTYLWSPVTGLSNPNIANPVANPVVTTVYTVTVTDGLGCSKTDNVTVTVKSNPVVNAGANTSICAGTSVTIGGAPTGPAGSGYSWAPSATLNNSAIANPIATPIANTTYTVTVTSNGCTNTGSLTVTLMPLPPANAGSDTTICLGAGTPLSASGGATYSWLPVTGLSDPNISNPTASPAVTTTYYVTVGWANPCTNTDSVIVTVNPLPNANAGNDVAICSGNNTQLNASGGLTYLWSPVTGLSNPNISNPIATPVVTTVYTVTVTDALGCFKTDNVTVTVKSNPVVNAGANTSICAGTSVTIGGAPTGPAGSTYSWAPFATLNNSALANPVATPLVNTTYTVTVTSNGCVNTGSVTVTLKPLPIADAGADVAICIGVNTLLTASGGTSYAWLPVTGLSNPAIFNPIASPVITTSYYVNVTGANACTKKDTVIVTVNPLPNADAGNNVWLCPGDNTILNASGGTVYSWSPVTYLSNPTIFNPVASPVDSIVYHVTVTDANGCSKTDSVAVLINRVVPTNAGLDITICKGDTTSIGGLPTSPLGTTYLWSPAASLDNPSVSNPKAFPTTTTIYYLNTANDTCVGKDSITVFVNTPATANAGTDATICIGGNTQLLASGGITYSWSPVTGLSNPAVFNPFASPAIQTTYTVSIIDINGCTNTDSVIVFVNNLPVVDAGSNAAICVGNSITLNASGGIAFSWSPPTDLSNTAIFNPIASPANTITYFVTVTDLNTCVNTDSVIITVNQLPVADAGNDTMMCIGNSVQLIASGGIGYVWTPSIDLSNSTIANPFTNSLNAITYTVSVTDANGCKNTDTVHITVNQLPVIDAGIDSQICIGESIQLNASGGINYVWSPVTNLSNPNSANPFADPVSTTEFFVTGTDNNSCVNSDSVILVVNQLPIVDAGLNAAICVGNSITLNASGGSSYSWSPTTGLSSPSIFNPIASPNNTITYFVTGTDVNTCVNSDSVVITVNSLPLANAGNDTMMCMGASVQLNAGGGDIYLWTPPASLTNSAIPNPFTNSLNTITYNVLVTDANGCKKNDSVHITVNPLPVVDAGIANQICIGDNIQLNATGGSSYIWSPAGTLNNSNIANPIANPGLTTMYHVTGTDNNSCVNSDSVKIIVNPLPTVDAGLNAAICISNSITLNATGGNTYSWTPATGLSNATIFNPIASPNNTITYFVTATDLNTCVNDDSVTITVNSLPLVNAGNDTMMCIGTSVQLNASGGIAYVWTPSTSLTNSTIANPVTSSLNTITYSVSVTDANGCKNTDSVHIIVNPLPVIDAGNALQICIGDSIQLNATGGTSYVWSPAVSLSNPNSANPFADPVITTVYHVTGTDNNSCVNSDSVTVDVKSLPLVTIDGGSGVGVDINICRGDTAILVASGGVSYTWTPLTNVNNAFSSSPKVYPDITTVYSVSATDINTCKNKDSIAVNVFRIAVTPDTSICEGDSVQLFVTGSNVFSYSWSPATGLNNPFIQNPWASPASTTLYTISGTDNNQCKDVAGVSVTVDIMPVAAFSAAYSPSCSGILADFTNESVNADSYLWNFGDGGASSQINVVHLFPYSASFIATLIAINNGKCADTTSLQNSISAFQDYFTISVPNVFTPNDDGNNDEFELKINGDVSDCFSITIYDRWGLQIFSSIRAKLQWDGRTTGGLKVVPGTYFYVIEINGMPYKGSITLLE